MITSQAMVDYAERALRENFGYVLGTYGQICTTTLLNQKRKQGGGVGVYNTRHSTYQNKFIGKRVTDCYGLVKGAVWPANSKGDPIYQSSGAKYADRNQEGAFNAAREKGPLSTIPELPGVILWMKGHAGIYVGNGIFIECVGSPVGMRKGRIQNGRVVSGSKFTHWFKDNWIEYGGVIMKGYIGLGSEDNTIQNVKQLQYDLVELGFDVGYHGRNGIMGDDTDKAIRDFQLKYGLEVDGKFGPASQTKMSEALKAKRNEVPLEELFYVRSTWAETDTEKGPFRNYEEAVTECNKYPGYHIYNNTQEQLYATPKVDAPHEDNLPPTPADKLEKENKELRDKIKKVLEILK